jgi:hypothetical protein
MIEVGSLSREQLFRSPGGRRFCIDNVSQQVACVPQRQEPSSAPLDATTIFGYRPTLGNTIAAFHIARIQLPSIGGELADIAGESRP